MRPAPWPHKPLSEHLLFPKGIVVSRWKVVHPKKPLCVRYGAERLEFAPVTKRLVVVDPRHVGEGPGCFVLAGQRSSLPAPLRDCWGASARGVVHPRTRGEGHLCCLPH
jgi:hypothetical protein